MPDQLITSTDMQEINKGAASGFAAGDNPHVRQIAGDQIRPTEYFVGLYSVNKRRMADSPFAFIVENGAYKAVCIPPCPADYHYIKVMDIPHPVQSLEADPHNFGQTVMRTQRAELVAMSIVNPDVFGTSMEHLPPQSALNKYSISSATCDLIRQGVFFTRAEEGTPEFKKALKAAEDRRDAYYRNILGGLQGMSDSNVQMVLGSEKGLDLRTAAEHFGEEYTWLRNRAPKVPCPNCFEKIPQGAAFHKNELLGVICVIDWERAVDAGVKTMAEVPPSKRWWTEEPIDEAEFEEPEQFRTTAEGQLKEPAPTVTAAAGKNKVIDQVRRGAGRPPRGSRA